MTIGRFGSAVLALALFAIIASLPATPAGAGEVTYPQLQTATTVQDTDLIATWRASGPLTKVQASVLSAYIQGKLSPLFLQPANNLSDLSNVGTARANLGLGSAALANVGTSGTALCQLNANCTWTGTETHQAKVTHGASTSAGAMLNLAPGAAPTTPVAGDLWDTSTSLFVYLNGAAQQIAFTSSSITGNAATASQWQTARTESLTGDVTGSATGINGAGNWSIAATLAATGVTATQYGGSLGAIPWFDVDVKGRITSAGSNPAPVAAVGSYGVIQLATAAQVIAGTNVPYAVTPSALPMRASGYFYGCSSSGCSTGGSTNVSGGLQRLGVGHYTMNFANAFPNTNFTFICTIGYGGSNNWFCQEDTATARSTTSVTLYITNSAGNTFETGAALNVMALAN